VVLLIRPLYTVAVNNLLPIFFIANPLPPQLLNVVDVHLLVFFNFSASSFGLSTYSLDVYLGILAYGVLQAANYTLPI